MLRKSDPSGKKKSKLYVEPAELARKLIKELEGSKVSRGGRTWVRDQYTVFLCREDFARFRSQLDQLVHKLESHMEKHMQNKRYATSGAITVELTMDPDLKPGYFGVLAERADYEGPDPRVGVRESAGRSIWDVPDDIDYDDDYKEDYVDPRARGARRGGQVPDGSSAPPSVPPMPSGAPVGSAAAGAAGAAAASQTPPALGPSYGRPFSSAQGEDLAAPSPLADQQAQRQPSAAPAPPVPPVAAPAQPAPATQTPVAPDTEALVLKVNGQERVFAKGKAVIGRSRDADVQIDSAEVSRQHAVIYTSEAGVMVRDLGSTNGTMVNGYPVDKSVVRPSDVIRVGNAHITAAPR